MKTRILLVVVTGLAMASCAPPDLTVTPEPTVAPPTIKSVDVDTYTGVDATKRALEAVHRELDTPVALAHGAQASGQSVADRRSYLESLVQDLQAELHMHEQGASVAGACTVHRDAEYRTRFTTAGISHGSAFVLGYTSATRSTEIRTSVYAEVVRGADDFEYGRGTTGESRVACGRHASVQVRLTYSIGRHDDGERFTVFGETAHIIPNRMTWTTDTDVYYVPIETRELQPDTTEEDGGP